MYGPLKTLVTENHHISNLVFMPPSLCLLKKALPGTV